MELKRGLAKVAFVLGLLGAVRIVFGAAAGELAPIALVVPLLLLLPYPMMRIGNMYDKPEDEIDHIPWE